MISLTPFPRSTDFPLLSMIKRCFGVCSSNISSPPWCSPTICSMEPVDCEENDGFFFFFDGEFLSPFLDDCWSVLTLFSELSSAWNYTFQSLKWYVLGLGLSDMSRKVNTYCLDSTYSQNGHLLDTYFQNFCNFYRLKFLANCWLQKKIKA